MKSASGSSTSPSLLGRLGQQPTDQAAWGEFVTRYGPKIYHWCRRWHLQDADAADVAQAVLLKLAQRMQTFVYDPAGSFRCWLKTLTHHAWQDLVQNRRELVPSEDHPIGELLQSLAARDDLMNSLEAAVDQEMLEEAMSRIRLRVHPRTWEAFQLTSLEGLSGPQAAARMGVPLTTVYKAKSNVQKLLQEEIRYLEGPAAS